MKLQSSGLGIHPQISWGVNACLAPTGGSKCLRGNSLRGHPCTQLPTGQRYHWSGESGTGVATEGSEVTHTPWLGMPARASHGPPSDASLSCPGTWASDISSLLPSLKNVGALSSTGVKASGTKQLLPAITLHLGSHQESV